MTSKTAPLLLRAVLFRCLAGAAGLALLVAAAPEAAAQFDFDEPWPPEVIIETPEGGWTAGGSLEAGVRIRPEGGIHVYRDKIEAAFTSLEGATFREIVLPEGKQIPDVINPGETVDVFEGEFSLTLIFQVTAPAGGAVRIEGTLSLQGCTDEICYPPHEEGFTFEGTAEPGTEPDPAEPVPAEAGATRDRDDGAAADAGSDGAPSKTKPVSEDGGDGASSEPAPGWGEILLKIIGAFGFGILLSLTPCVLPIIPITSAIIQRFSRGGKASTFYASCIYVLGMAITYSAAGLAVAFVGGQVRSFLNSPYVLGAIGVIFVALALSMFGLYDISLPSGLAGKLQKTSADQAQKQNRFALLVMGMIAGIVAGPCLTAPLAALLTWIASTGNPYIGFAVMFALSWGIGVLIIAAGTSTSMVPKAGEWTEWFRRLFGFVTIWGALYFTRTLLPAGVYELGTALVLVTGAVFLGGLDSLPSGAGWGLRVKKLLGVLGIMTAFFIAFDYFLHREGGVPAASGGAAAAEVNFIPGGEADLDLAMERGEPAVLYFTATWCTNCKVLKKVLNHAEVSDALERMPELLALQVDFDEEEELRNRYKVKGPPTVVFIDRRGMERKDLRFTGTKITPAEFISRLEGLYAGAPALEAGGEG